MNKTTKAKILLNKNLIIAPHTTVKTIGETNKDEMSKSLALVSSSFKSLGYQLTKEDYRKLSRVDINELKTWYISTFNSLKEILGVSIKHTVFYGNFPNFDNMSALEVEVRRILSYLTFDNDNIGLGQVEETEKEELKDNVKLTTLKLISERDAEKVLVEYAQNYLGSKNAVPDSIFEMIKELYEEYGIKILPEKFEFKETMVKVIKMLGGLSALDVYDSFVFIKTTTDLLRLYAVLSDGDPELASVKFKSLSRKYRKWFMRNLDSIVLNNKAAAVDDLHRKRFLWLKAAEYLHSGEYSKAYPNASEALTDLRNSNYTTWNSKVEKALKEDLSAALTLLKQKPGEFARRLDYLLRTYNMDKVLEAFKEVSSKISTPVLFQLLKLFRGRTELLKTRVFKLKAGKLHSEEDNRKVFSLTEVSKISDILFESLRDIYGSRPSFGKVYLSEEMKQYAIPENSRTASAGLHTLTPGSRVKIPEGKNIVRCFTHWKNIPRSSEDSRFYGISGYDRAVDIDLSAEAFDENLNYKGSLAWHDLNGWRKWDCYHSGDIRTAPKGASEFIDLNLKALQEADIRYIMINNSSFSGNKYSDIPECFSGFMLRENDGRTGDIFDARTVETKFDLTADCGSEIAFIVDVKLREIIWVDKSLNEFQSSTVAAGSRHTAMVLAEMIKPIISLYDLVKLNEKHLEFVDKPEDANVKIGTFEGATLTPYDIEKWSGEWM